MRLANNLITLASPLKVVICLMSSMARRAELQTISRATDLFSVCSLCTFAHLEQISFK
uniref:Uncharacterized protein n=1 Tax=Anguilla anguilla TaxID=7936 RepID=A0A0E9UU98_ANGAN